MGYNQQFELVKVLPALKNPNNRVRLGLVASKGNPTV
jgi:hypothetical protein